VHPAKTRNSPPTRPKTEASAPVASAATVSREPAARVGRHTVVGHRPTHTRRPRRPRAARVATRTPSPARSRSGVDNRGGLVTRGVVSIGQLHGSSGVNEGPRRATTPPSAGSHRGGPSVGGETVGSSPSPRGSSPTTPSTPTSGSTGRPRTRTRSGGVGIGAGTGTTSGGG